MAPESHWSASRACLVRSKPVRDTIIKNGSEDCCGMTPLVDLQPHCVAIDRHTDAQTHAPHSRKHAHTPTCAMCTCAHIVTQLQIIVFKTIFDTVAFVTSQACTWLYLDLIIQNPHHINILIMKYSESTHTVKRSGLLLYHKFKLLLWLYIIITCFLRNCIQSCASVFWDEGWLWHQIVKSFRSTTN